MHRLDSDASQFWPWLPKFPQLRELTLNDTSGYEPQYSSESQLQCLTLTRVRKAPAHLLHFPRLASLSISADGWYFDNVSDFQGVLLLDLTLLESLTDLWIFATRLPTKCLLGTARSLKSCFTSGFDGTDDDFYPRHADSLESLEMRRCAGKIQATFPRLRALTLGGCNEGILVESLLPSLTHLYVDEDQHSTFNPCAEFASSLRDSVEKFLFVGTNKRYKRMNTDWFEPLARSRTLTDVQCFGVSLAKEFVDRLEQCGLKEVNFGGSSRDFRKDRILPQLDPEQLWISTKMIMQRRESIYEDCTHGTGFHG